MSSHWHWDHCGDASQFPNSAEIVVGPGFKENFLPGYPVNPNSPMLDLDTKYEALTLLPPNSCYLVLYSLRGQLQRKICILTLHHKGVRKSERSASRMASELVDSLRTISLATGASIY